MKPIEQSIPETLLRLCEVPSPIGEEKALCDYVEKEITRILGAQTITRFHHSLIVRAAERPGFPKIAFAGHLDTVRTEHDKPPRIENGRVYGLGSSDMKSGLALMIELVQRLDLKTIPWDLTLIFYEGEEGPYNGNRLGPMLEEFSLLREFDLAVALEPSDNEMQLGAMGSMQANVIFHGRTAHSARPWQGDNALYKAATFLTQLSSLEPKDINIDGHIYREVMTPTLIKGGRAQNVIPDRVELNVNFRFAPNKGVKDAEEEIKRYMGDRATVEITDASPAGRPHAKNPLVKHLASCGVTAIKPKQAWTDVARFDVAGVPGVNLGPGTNAQAHQRNEYTEIAPLIAGYKIFERFLTTTPAK